MAYNKDDQKKETFETPKMVDIEGKEVTADNLAEDELEKVSGGGNTCSSGISVQRPEFT